MIIQEGMNMMYNIIAIEREYASGGNEIGERVARWLGIAESSFTFGRDDFQ